MDLTLTVFSVQYTQAYDYNFAVHILNHNCGLILLWGLRYILHVFCMKLFIDNNVLVILKFTFDIFPPGVYILQIFWKPSPPPSWGLLKTFPTI